MKCQRFLQFLLFQTFSVFAAEENPKNFLSSYFRTLENKQLKGYVVKRFDSPSLMSCSQQCMRNEWCTSTNYDMSSKKDGKATCELNKHDISLINENTNFHDEPGVIFAMFMKGCLITSCLNGGSCLPDKEKQSFSCSCKSPWTGERCEVKMDCPHGWVLHGSSYYRVIDTPALKRSDGRKMCQDLGGDLPIIKSPDENGFIVDLLKKQRTVQIKKAWLGLNREADNTFYWINGTPLEGQYSEWANGEPNNVHEKCVHIYATGNRTGTWNDIKCDFSNESKAPVILCQKKYI